MKKITKKYLALIVALAMVFSCLSMSAFAAEEAAEDYIEWSFDEETKTLTVNGNGEIPDYDYYLYAPWNEYYNDIEKLVIGEGITVISECAFMGLLNLKEAVLPESLIAISDAAFFGCTKLKKINLPHSISKIGDEAFFGVAFETLTVPKNLEDGISLLYTYIENLIIPADAGKITVTILSSNAKNVVNYSTDAIVDASSEYIDDIENKYFKAVQKYCEIGIKAEINGVYDDTRAIMKAFSEVYGVDISTKEEFDKFTDKWVYDTVSLYCPDSFYINCLEESSQHNYCRERVINHKIIGSDELCECFAFKASYVNGNGFVIDKDSRTAVVNGSGELNGYAIVLYNNYFDTVVFSEDSDFTVLGYGAFQNIDVESFDIPDTVEILETNLFHYSKIKNITIPVSVVQIDEAAFFACYNLENVYYEGSYEQWKEINIDKYNDYNKWLFDANLYFDGVLHKHTVVKGETVAPTCSSEGYTVYECDCGYYYKDDYTAASTHTDENADYICDVCGSEIDKTVTDDESGIIFETKDEADFTVVEIEDKNDLDYILVESLISGGLAGLYDIKMTDSEGNPVQPETTVKVKLPVGDAEGPFSIYRVEENGTLTNMNAYREGEYMVFVTDHFSLYVLVDESVTEDEENTDENEKSDCGEDCDCLCHTHKLLRLIFIILNIVMKYLDVEPLCNC